MCISKKFLLKIRTVLWFILELKIKSWEHFMSCQEFHNWARGNRKIFQVPKKASKIHFTCLDIEIHWRILDLGKQKCFINYLKFKLTKKLEISDETINRVVWKILRPILLSNFKSCCCSPEFVPFHSIELGESRSTLQQGKYPY